MINRIGIFWSLSLFCTSFSSIRSFSSTTENVSFRSTSRESLSSSRRHGRPSSVTRTFLFDKMFEEEGLLGKGITVGKVQVALNAKDRTSRNSIFTLLESHAADDSDANEDLARMANDVCLALIRRSDDWVAACSTSRWFNSKDAGKAERYYNELSNTEAAKFEKVRREECIGEKFAKILRHTSIS